MKILQIHNRYKIQGGEWTVLNQEFDLLKRNHDVKTLIVDNSEELNSVLSKAKLIFTTHYNKTSKKLVKRRLEQTGAEIMHVHNFFPLLSPSVFDAAREASVPSVFTLHNYRLVHPNGYLLHNGKIDERSIKGNAYSCVKDGVYRESVLQTAVVAHMIEYHRQKGTWQQNVDAFICLTEFARQKFIEAGLPSEKLKVKPNFVNDTLKEINGGERVRKKEPYYLFIGRISEEKGIRTLLRAWNQLGASFKKKLIIIGDGPLRATLHNQYRSNKDIMWAGFAGREEVMRYLLKAEALIFPSEWYEGMPMTILEAFCMGTPVISSNIGSQKEIVRNNLNGLHFHAGDAESLIRKINYFDQHEDLKDELGEAARREYEEKYMPGTNYEKLISIYRELLTAKA